MLRKCRILLALVAVVATWAAPCVPAATSTPPCSMPDCDDGPFSEIGSRCCCSSEGAPASSTTGTQVPSFGLKGPSHDLGTEIVQDAGFTELPDFPVVQPNPSPLYILHASLLI